LNLNSLTEGIGTLTLNNGDVGGGGTLTLGGDVVSMGAGLNEILSSVNLGGATRTFTVADLAAFPVEMSINGGISNGGLTKAGAGTLRLVSSNSSYTGPTSVDAGTLVVQGNISGSATAVNSGATISGNGTTGLLSISGNANLEPGNGVGTLTAAGLTLTSGAFVRFELAAPGTVGGSVNDLLTINGNLTLDGTLVVTELAGFANGTYRLANYTGVLLNNGLDLQPAFLTAHPGSNISTATAGQVNLIVIPEPSSAALFALGAALPAYFRRSRANGHSGRNQMKT
jgi:fibronectin-binding autotransporter adhesin